MLSKLFLIGLIVVSSCGQSAKKSATPPLEDTTPTVTEIDSAKIPNLLPTTYYIPQEKNISCSGKYGSGSHVYTADEKTAIIGLKDEVISVVCSRFYKFLLMEGSAILKNEQSINYGGIKEDGQRRFYVLDRCIFGEGTRRNLCLLPYHTLAADNKVHKINDIIFIPKVRGLRLPDGSIHEGYFIVRDTGGAFTGVGAQRVDMFTGIESDSDNVFLKAGFDRRNPMPAFKISGLTAEIVRQNLKDRFGEMY